jgi:hypothetical protein
LVPAVVDKEEPIREFTQRLEVVPETTQLVSASLCTVALVPAVVDKEEPIREFTQRLEVAPQLQGLAVGPSRIVSFGSETGIEEAVPDTCAFVPMEASRFQFGIANGVDAHDELSSAQALPCEKCIDEQSVGEACAIPMVDLGRAHIDEPLEVTSPLELVTRRAVVSVDFACEGLGCTYDSAVPAATLDRSEHQDIAAAEEDQSEAWRNDKVTSDVARSADCEQTDNSTDADMTVIPLGSYELRYFATETTEPSLCQGAIHEQTSMETTRAPDWESTGCGLEELLSLYGSRMHINPLTVRTTTEYRSHILRQSMSASDTEALAAKLSAHTSWEDPELGRSLRALAGLDDSRVVAHVGRDAQCVGADHLESKGQV